MNATPSDDPVLTAEIVNEAFDRTERFIEFLRSQGWLGDRKGFLITAFWKESDLPRGVERLIGALDYSKHPYDRILASKERLTREWEKPTDEIPLVYRDKDDTIYHGSEWNTHLKYGVAGTGYQAYYDKLICQFAVAQIADLLGDVNLGDPDSSLKVEGDFLVRA